MRAAYVDGAAAALFDVTLLDALPAAIFMLRCLLSAAAMPLDAADTFRFFAGAVTLLSLLRLLHGAYADIMLYAMLICHVAAFARCFHYTHAPC